jgi:hypothetical protein
MLTLWNDGRKGKNYNFIDRHISNHIRMSGTGILVHMYLGVPDKDGSVTSLTKIQDVVFLENRDRKYSKDVIQLIGCYNVQDVDFDLRQFGIFLANDTLFIEFHINDMLAILGRKLIPGDVLELPHMRDDTQLDPEAKAINRFYVVQDVNRGASGFSATWYGHIWRVKAAPMTGAQEYADILDQQALDPFGFGQGMKLRDIMTTEKIEEEINDAVVEEAVQSVSRRYFETRQFYYVPGSETGDPWVFAGDGNPPNGAALLGSGDVFPTEREEGDYFLRTDYTPVTLFQYENNRWTRREVDHRTSHWSAANRVLESFFNNTNETTLDDGSTISERAALSKVLKYRPEADF